MTQKNPIRCTVVGAGHGGKAMAADIAGRGFPVRLYNRTYEHIEEIVERGGIEVEVEDGREVFGEIECATSNIGQALEDSHLVMVVVPASAHSHIARGAAPYVREGQVIVLNPGRTGGALEFVKVLRENGCTSMPLVCEAETLIYAARSMGPSEAKIFRRKNSVPVAALPALRTPEALSILRQVFPQFIRARNVLYTSLNNMGAVFHPALTVLNAGRIENTLGDFEFYMDGVTPSTAKVLEALDRERVTVAAALGVRAQTALEWLERAYSADGENLHDAMHANPGYSGIKAPNRLNHRYLFEDVPFSLVPISKLGQWYGVKTDTITAMVNLVCVMHGTDYWHNGRTPEDMGLKGMSIPEITRYVEEGPVQ